MGTLWENMSVARFQARHNDAVGAGSKDSEGIVERTEICPKRVLTRRRMTAASVAAALACTRQSVQAGDRIDKSTLAGKLIMGYQGWFACPDDGAGFGWGHWGWIRGGPGADTVDVFPDVMDLPVAEQLGNATQACRRSTNSGVRQPQCYDGRTALYLDAAVWTGWHRIAAVCGRVVEPTPLRKVRSRSEQRAPRSGGSWPRFPCHV